MKNVLVLILLFVSKAAFSQSLSFNRLLLLQKQDFSSTNNFFISGKWQVGEAEKGASNTYSVIWMKKGQNQGCRITYYDYTNQDVEESLKKAASTFTKVVYSFMGDDTYNAIKNDVEKAGYKPTKPIIEDGVAFSTYTNGNYVVAIGNVAIVSSRTVYKVMVDSYLAYYIKQKRKEK